MERNEMETTNPKQINDEYQSQSHFAVCFVSKKVALSDYVDKSW